MNNNNYEEKVIFCNKSNSCRKKVIVAVGKVIVSAEKVIVVAKKVIVVAEKVIVRSRTRCGTTSLSFPIYII